MRCSLAGRGEARAVKSPISSSSSPSLSSSSSSRPRPRLALLAPRLPHLPLRGSARALAPAPAPAALAAVAFSSSAPLSPQEKEDLDAFLPFLPDDRGGGGEEEAFSSPDDPDLAWRLLSRFTAADFAGKAPSLLSDPRRRQALRLALRVVSRSPRAANGWFPASSDSDSDSTDSSSPPSPPPPPPLVVAVLASSHELACRALRDYLDLFGLPYCPPAPRIAAGSGGVFVKVSASSLVALAVQGEGEGEREGTATTMTTSSSPPSPLQPPRASPYVGKDRGVLVTLGDTQFGHLPLGLLDEEREKPAPKLG